VDVAIFFKCQEVFNNILLENHLHTLQFSDNMLLIPPESQMEVTLR